MLRLGNIVEDQSQHTLRAGYGGTRLRTTMKLREAFSTVFKWACFQLDVFDNCP
jgi:hypothetical protein